MPKGFRSLSRVVMNTNSFRKIISLVYRKINFTYLHKNVPLTIRFLCWELFVILLKFVFMRTITSLMSRFQRYSTKIPCRQCFNTQINITEVVVEKPVSLAELYVEKVTDFNTNLFTTRYHKVIKLIRVETLLFCSMQTPQNRRKKICFIPVIIYSTLIT